MQNSNLKSRLKGLETYRFTEISLLLLLGENDSAYLIKAKVTTLDFRENINLYPILSKGSGNKKSSVHKSAICLHEQMKDVQTKQAI